MLFSIRYIKRNILHCVPFILNGGLKSIFVRPTVYIQCLEFIRKTFNLKLNYDYAISTARNYLRWRCIQSPRWRSRNLPIYIVFYSHHRPLLSIIRLYLKQFLNYKFTILCYHSLLYIFTYFDKTTTIPQSNYIRTTIIQRSYQNHTTITPQWHNNTTI